MGTSPELDSGVQCLLRVAGAHHEEEAFGKLWADPPSRGGHAFASADQEVRQQGDPLAVGLAQTVSLQRDTAIFSIYFQIYMLMCLCEYDWKTFGSRYLALIFKSP